MNFSILVLNLCFELFISFWIQNNLSDLMIFWSLFCLIQGCNTVTIDIIESKARFKVLTKLFTLTESMHLSPSTIWRYLFKKISNFLPHFNLLTFTYHIITCNICHLTVCFMKCRRILTYLDHFYLLAVIQDNFNRNMF